MSGKEKRSPPRLVVSRRASSTSAVSLLVATFFMSGRVETSVPAALNTLHVPVFNFS